MMTELRFDKSNTLPDNTQSSALPDRRTVRRQERHARRMARRSATSPWLGGLFLIALGGIFLLQNAGLLYEFAHTWALFLLLPAIGAFATALKLYQRNGHQWTPLVIGPLIGGTLLTVLSLGFLLGVDGQLLWPFILIGGGLTLLVGHNMNG